MRSSRQSKTVAAALVLVVVTPTAIPLSAGPINTDVALTPRKGGSIVRLQFVYTELDEHRDIQHINTSTAKATYVYGLRKNLALFLTVPYVNRQVDRFDRKFGRIEDAHDGIGDLTFLAKYRFWQDDRRPGETLRWAALGGLNFRSGDSDFSSDSYDPIVGTVFSWRRQRGRFDADVVYQLNTGRQEYRHDALRYDVAYSHRLFPAIYDAKDAWEFDCVAELNGKYVADGSHQVFLSPGLQFITQQWVFETSIQLPVIQDLDGPETDYRFVVGFRFQW